MKFSIDRGIFEKFPGLTVGVLVCKNLDNSGGREEIQKEIALQEKNIREKYDLESLSLDPKIGAWRKAYAAFGTKPKDNKSSVENLYRMVLKGINLRRVNKLVDIYNLVSLKYMFPVGGEDLDRIQGNVALTFAGPNEPTVLLLGDKEPRPPRVGEVIYKDDISAICRRWNWREAERTKLSEGTKNCLLVLEGLSPAARQEIETAARELEDLVRKFCGGNVSHVILDEKRSEADL